LRLKGLCLRGGGAEYPQSLLMPIGMAATVKLPRVVHSADFEVRRSGLVGGAEAPVDAITLVEEAVEGAESYILRTACAYGAKS
jgi:hypothetical protein